MYLTHVRHRVNDFDTWKKAFDHNANLLFKKFGCIDTFIVKVNGDDTDIVIINLWPSKKNWDDFGALHELPEYKGKTMTPEQGGVIGEPEWYGGEVEKR